MIEDMRAEWRELDARIEAFDAELIATARQDDACRRLCAIPGIGALNAAALVAAVGNGSVFDKGRDIGGLAGLVPREHSTGSKQRLLGISKPGNKYLRTLLIHGARAACRTSPRGMMPSVPGCGCFSGESTETWPSWR